MSDELKPCPFCGWAGTLHEYIDEKNYATIQCPTCGAMVCRFRDIREARAAWNRRAEPAPAATDLDALASSANTAVTIAANTKDYAMANRRRIEDLETRVEVNVADAIQGMADNAEHIGKVEVLGLLQDDRIGTLEFALEALRDRVAAMEARWNWVVAQAGEAERFAERVDALEGRTSRLLSISERLYAALEARQGHGFGPAKGRGGGEAE